VFSVVNVLLVAVAVMDFVVFARVLVVVMNGVFRIGLLQVTATHLLQGDRATVCTL